MSRIRTALPILVGAAVALSGCTTSGTPMAAPFTTTSTTTVTSTPSDDYDDSDDDSLDIETSHLPEPTTTTPEPTTPPAPANAATMTCTEYLTLSDATQVAVIAVHGVNKNPFFAALIIEIFCERNTGDTVAQAITRIKPEFLYK